MLNNGNKKECGFADDIVSYIYDEIAPVERQKFESHLTGCTACTDEFAGISNARFSVFEWNREEFANLETPDIVIPYAPAKETAAGFFTGLREMMTLSGWSSAVMVAGAVIICIGLGFVTMNFIGGRSGQIAENKKPVVNEQSVPAPVIQERPNLTVAQAPQKALPTSVATSVRPVPTREIRSERASVPAPRVREKNLTASTQVVGPSMQQKRNAPALTPSVEDDDKSLRLADLFDEGGS